MTSAKIVISLDERSLTEIDRLVARGVYPNRRKAIESAVSQRISREHRSRLGRECAALDPKEEQAFADEGFGKGHERPEY